MCGFSWRGRRFKFLFVHCFLLWCLILSSGKKHFVREIFCKMQNTDSPEQVRWYTWNVRMSISSKQCCLFPESVGIYLEYVQQRKGCFKWSKPEGIFLWFIFGIEVNTEDLGEPWRVFIQWGFSLKNGQCSINPRARVCSEQFGAFEPLLLFRTWMFCSLDGSEESSWQFRAALAAFTRGETSQGVGSRRDLKQHHQKLNSVTFLNIWQHEKPYCA